MNEIKTFLVDDHQTNKVSIQVRNIIALKFKQLSSYCSPKRTQFEPIYGGFKDFFKKFCLTVFVYK